MEVCSDRVKIQAVRDAAGPSIKDIDVRVIARTLAIVGEDVGLAVDAFLMVPRPRWLEAVIDGREVVPAR